MVILKKVNGEKIKGERPINNHTEAVKVLVEELLKYKAVDSLDEIAGIGHRVLHGGEIYAESVLITDEVIKNIESLTKLGPLHIPGNLAGIKAMKEALPSTPMVAVFDTAFHQTMPELNYIYPVPYEWYEKYGVRKYGFHGTSHKYITLKMQDMLGKKDVNLIICHIGSGSSICCVKDGKSYDTTMGLTPLDGLMMGTRCGSIDPSIIEYVCKESGMDVSQVTNALNKQSGLLGISRKSADHRDVEKAIEEGDKLSLLANDLYIDRVVNYIAQYFVKLDGKVDGIVFTAGLGENACEFREAILNKLGSLGIKIDKNKNMNIASYREEHEGKVSTDDSKVAVYVIPTNEELMIIKDTYDIINK